MICSSAQFSCPNFVTSGLRKKKKKKKKIKVATDRIPNSKFQHQQWLRWRRWGGVEASGKAQGLYQHWRSWGEAMLNWKVSKNTQRDWSSSAPCRGVKKKKKKKSGSEWSAVLKLALMIRWAAGVWGRSSRPPRKTTASLCNTHLKTFWHKKTPSTGEKNTQSQSRSWTVGASRVLHTLFSYYWRQS